MFYEVYNEEAYIINNLFNYKINEYKNYIRVGFPVNSFDKVINKLNNYKINYIIVDKENKVKTFRTNNYSKYIHIENIKQKIDNIYDKLILKSSDPSIINTLNEIEKILN